MTSDVRPAAVAGSWYPSTPERLGPQIDRYMADADTDASTPPRAIVAPHAGLMYSGPVAAFAYRTVAGVRYAAVILVGELELRERGNALHVGNCQNRWHEVMLVGRRLKMQNSKCKMQTLRGKT
jgi:hypothetical protein